MNRLKLDYENRIKANLKTALGLTSVMQVPVLKKIVINVSASDAVTNSKVIGVLVEELSQIAGQRAVVTKAKKSISNFKLREGMQIGARVTLRGDRMWAFLDRLISLALPRVRDFRGLPNRGFDGRGNYNLGLREQIVFPEINYDKVEKVRGMNITICTSADEDSQARMLLELLGIPFRK